MNRSTLPCWDTTPHRPHTWSPNRTAPTWFLCLGVPVRQP